MRSGGKTTNPSFAVNLPKGIEGSNPSGLLFPNSTGSATPASGGAASSIDNIAGMMKSQAIGGAVTTGIQAVGTIAATSIGHAMKISALNHQQRQQNRAWRASIEAIKEQSHLVDDIQSIQTAKIEKGSTFVESKKDLEIAEARYLEAKKTEKTMKEANKTLVKKALSDRRSQFYGKTA